MHVIRLRGNWTFTPLALFHRTPEGVWSVLPAEGEPTLIKEPALWRSQVDPDFRGRVRLARRFHSPTGIGPSDVVAVAFEHCGVAGSVYLDGSAIGDFDSSDADPPVVFSQDIREQLQQGHELAIEIEWPKLADLESPDNTAHAKTADPVLGVVRLEIRPA